MKISEIMEKMIAFSKGNIHDINHFMCVWTYAKTIGELENLDQETQYILEVAAITHDIACPFCREKYGNTNGKYQEKEGMPIVKEFLADTGMSEAQIERVAYLVGHHHTLKDIEGIDYQILIEADYIVNAYESEYSKENIENFIEKVMKTREEALKFGLSFKNVYEERPFKDQNWQLVRVKGSKKAFLWIYERDGYINLNVKVNPEWRDFWRSAYDAVIAGYHQNKEYWNTIILDGSIPDKDIKRMIAESYDIITDSPTKRIYEAVKRIPKGHVATYGKVAEMAGNAKMSRAVGNALHKNPDPEHIPCFRVVNAKGELAGAFAFGGERTQAKLLEEDGVAVIDGKVDLKKYGI